MWFVPLFLAWTFRSEAYRHSLLAATIWSAVAMIVLWLTNGGLGTCFRKVASFHKWCPNMASTSQSPVKICATKRVEVNIVSRPHFLFFVRFIRLVAQFIGWYLLSYSETPVWHAVTMFYKQCQYFKKVDSSRRVFLSITCSPDAFLSDIIGLF